MGSSTQQSTSTSGPSNPDLNDTLDKLAKGIGSEYTQGKSLYQRPGAATQNSWTQGLAAAGNPDYASGIGGAMRSFGRTASGADIGMNAPGFMAMRNRLSNDVMTGANAAFNGSGMFGSDSNQRAVGQGLGDALGQLDYQNYRASIGDQQQAAGMLPQLFTAGQLPSAAIGSIGASQDLDRQRQADGPTDYLARMTSILGGAAGAGGTSTTNTTPSTPWWQTALGLGLSLI